MWWEANEDFYHREVFIVKRRQPDLHYCITDRGMCLIGTYHLFVVNNGITMEDDFDIRMEFPSNYPERLPTVYDNSDNLQIGGESHVNSDRSLCLGIGSDLYRRFHPGNIDTVLNFVDSFLYFYSYRVDIGEDPFADWSHGDSGIYCHWALVLECYTIAGVFGLLAILRNHQRLWRGLCPCGSGAKYYKCHIHQLDKVKSLPYDILLPEVISVWNLLPSDQRHYELPLGDN